MRRLFGLLALAVSCAWAQKEPFSAQALMQLARISEPRMSPDGKSVAFTVETPDVENNTKSKQIYTVPVAGGDPLLITRDGSQNLRPRWMPDSKNIVFISNRSGSMQIWMMALDGSNPRQVINISTEAAGVSVAPDGKHLVFLSDVYPECKDDPCNKNKLEAEAASPVKARVYSALPVRQWNVYRGARRTHILSVPVSGGPAKDLTPGPLDAPTAFLEGQDDYSISPDGGEVAYVAKLEEQQSLSTNTDILTVPIEGGETKKLAAGPGSERSPLYSPDGKSVAFRSQARAGYESDRWRLSVVDRASGQISILTEAQDRPVDSIAWSPDSSRLFYTSQDRGRAAVQVIAATGGSARAVITGASHIDDVQLSTDSKTMVYTEQSGSKPVEIYRASSGGGAAVPLTKLNDTILARYALSPLEEFFVEGADKAKVHAFLVKPAGFVPGRKYPLLLLIHGGPQGAWGESWSYRWNAQVFAAAGYAVVMPNPRGSVGYGQKFTDEINGDWGGKPYEDLMAVTDHAAALPYVDSERMAAAGASYGGYMVNWLMGHTQRFKALVSHAGTFDLAGSNVETEELWFPVWEFKGMPWENPDLYVNLSPSTYVKSFRTPTLVTHGELDYRVPVGQALGLFTALQVQKVPSKLVLFPDEGHWILKPQNSVLWYTNVLGWLAEWTKKPEPPK
ncbi:MAG TPA: S9 family peptidase [Bryobacteraceae bacterium]|nr:S9 family peptidase [Bryobacteraceae bacterium]